jgi:hypothetical protein
MLEETWRDTEYLLHVLRITRDAHFEVISYFERRFILLFEVCTGYGNGDSNYELFCIILMWTK